MRRQLHAFRPWLSDILEARAVPATLSVTTPVGVLGLNVTLPSQVPITSPQVQKAFAAFDQSYINAVDNILLAPTANGVIVVSANRAAFDSAVEQSLETLAQQLVLSVASTTPTVSNEVVAAIVGTGSTSLASQLEAVSDSAIQQLNLANVTSVSTTTSTLLANVVSTAEQVRPTNRIPEAEPAGASLFSTDPSSSSTSSSPTTKAGSDVRSAFGNFLNDYFQAVQGTLLAPGANGQVNPTANRAAFDAQVNQALLSLETRLSTTLTRYPATSGLGPQIQSVLEGNGGSSLKTQLSQIATPTGTHATVVRDFTLGSTQAIAQALSLISGDVASVLNPSGK